MGEQKAELYEVAVRELTVAHEKCVARSKLRRKNAVPGDGVPRRSEFSEGVGNHVTAARDALRRSGLLLSSVGVQSADSLLAFTVARRLYNGHWTAAAKALREALDTLETVRSTILE
jgi:hypothetical protein